MAEVRNRSVGMPFQQLGSAFGHEILSLYAAHTPTDLDFRPLHSSGPAPRRGRHPAGSFLVSISRCASDKDDGNQRGLMLPRPSTFPSTSAGFPEYTTFPRPNTLAKSDAVAFTSALPTPMLHTRTC
jgi:hypothetical protein